MVMDLHYINALLEQTAPNSSTRARRNLITPKKEEIGVAWGLTCSALKTWSEHLILLCCDAHLMSLSILYLSHLHFLSAGLNWGHPRLSSCATISSSRRLIQGLKCRVVPLLILISFYLTEFQEVSYLIQLCIFFFIYEQGFLN